MKEECEQRKEERKKVEKKETQHRNRVNKSFEKIPRFDGSTPHYCFHWLEQTEALSNRYPDRNYKEELLFNCGNSVSKTIHAVPEGATNQQIKDAVLTTTQTYALYLNDQMLTKTCTKNQMRLFKLTTPDTHHTSNLLTQNWTLMTHSRGCIAFTTHHHSMANLVTR